MAQDVEMMVVGDDEACIGGEGTIYELVVILVLSDKFQLEARIDIYCVGIVEDEVYDGCCYGLRRHSLEYSLHVACSERQRSVWKCMVEYRSIAA